ncbi:Auxin Efflux Carrier [Desulfurococcus mucosus DSM 2162]|uniref:Auxin Efflux Carrier n=1 Tax=Desulfurococcus mucosus (strain ATCC 35584 / DSM 2162 / JCM 9187 / O7/1) TaxID=765177 RepID=E8R9F9_DESM0|nr:Auxin Efflux Carrier [Desulfurococcus mucosus DSM 2162]
MNEIVLLMLLMGVGVSAQLVFKHVLGLGVFFDRMVRVLVDVVYRVLIPLAFLKTYLERGLDSGDTWIAFSFIVFTFVSAVSLSLIARGRPREYYGALFLASTFPNAVFLGFPVSMALFGSIHVASIYGLVTLVLNVLLPDLMAVSGFSLRRILLMPALLGFIAGLGGHYAAPSWFVNWITSALWWAPQALSYTATAVLGARLPLRMDVLRRNRRFLGVVALYRFLISPAVTALVLLVSRVDVGLSIQAVTVSLMPPAVMNTLIAERHGWMPELVASTTFLLTLAVVLCLPLFSALLH